MTRLDRINAALQEFADSEHDVTFEIDDTEVNLVYNGIYMFHIDGTMAGWVDSLKDFLQLDQFILERLPE